MLHVLPVMCQAEVKRAADLAPCVTCFDALTNEYKITSNDLILIIECQLISYPDMAELESSTLLGFKHKPDHTQGCATTNSSAPDYELTATRK